MKGARPIAPFGGDIRSWCLVLYGSDTLGSRCVLYAVRGRTVIIKLISNLCFLISLNCVVAPHSFVKIRSDHPHLTHAFLKLNVSVVLTVTVARHSRLNCFVELHPITI